MDRKLSQNCHLRCNNKTYTDDSGGFCCSDVLQEQCTQTQVQSLFIDPDVFDLHVEDKRNG